MNYGIPAKRTHTCGQLRISDIDNKVVLQGWVDKRRDLGNLIFIDLRNKDGKTQIVFDPEKNAALHKEAENLRSEFVISVEGIVKKRIEPNKKIKTGEIEVIAHELTILNNSETPPISISESSEENEDIRLKYRYLDLRKPFMQNNIIFRHNVLQKSRNILSSKGFIEIETPILMKSTPEGARDFLVPSRVNKGKFYALPQSPQTYKQLLMVSGFEKYFQIAKCFRDEDLRADRQPEFTQIDCELSYVDKNDIIDIFSDFLQKLFEQTLDITIGSIPKMTYQYAMDNYGSDKPDLRFDMKITDITDCVKESDFKVFSSTINNNGVIKGINAKGCANFSRKNIDELTKFVSPYGAKGLLWMRVTDTKFEGPAIKFLTKQHIEDIRSKLEGKPEDMFFIVASDLDTVNKSLGALRLEIAKQKNLLDKNKFAFTWITDFPMFEYNDSEKIWTPMHHPFTSPLDEDISLLFGPEYYLARAKAYDIVLNGNEIGGGSIRIHDRKLQSKIFELLNMSQETAQSKFGFLLDAFKYGAPPHGGIAFGLDRLVMLMLKLNTIRDVIPFPKTTTASSLMDNSPSLVDKKQLDELGIKIID